MKINWKVVIALGLVVWVIGSSQTILITVVVVSGALFYISHTTEHRWIRRFRRMDTSVQDTQPIAVVGGMDREGRAHRSHDYSGQDR
jgi:hypothetical protein